MIVSSTSAATVPIELALREADTSDCEFVWRVNNQRSVRDQAVHTEAIPYVAHRAWYVEQLSRSDRVVLIGSAAKRPISVVRFEIDCDRRDAIVAIAVCDDHSGRGFGTTCLRLAADHLLGEGDIGSITAQVRPTNVRSRRMFERAGFTLIGSNDHELATLITFELRRAPAGR